MSPVKGLFDPQSNRYPQVENQHSVTNTGKGKKEKQARKKQKRNSKVFKKAVLEMASGYEHLLLSVDPGSNPTPTWWHNIVCNSSSRVSNTLFWPPEALHIYGAQTYTHAQNSLKHQETIGLYNKRKQEHLGGMEAEAWRL